MEISLQLPPECRDILTSASKRAKSAKTLKERERIINEAIELCKSRFPKKFYGETKNTRKRAINTQAKAMALAEDGASIAEIVSATGVSRYIAKQMIESVLKAKAAKHDIRHRVSR